MPRIRSTKNICLECYGDLDAERECLTCGKRADDTPGLAHHLPKRAVLNGRYLIVRALGEGGFGITYLAWDLMKHRKCAVKEYYPAGFVSRIPKSCGLIVGDKQNLEACNRGLDRFIDEAKALAQIKSLPGIVSVHDFFAANGTAYIVTEFLDGISLKRYVQKKGGRISADEALAILRPVMESLEKVHNLSILHRDISPDNILITKYNQVKLIDFGAARLTGTDGTLPSVVLKQGFAPEEQYRPGGEQGAWTDVYALGVTIYYCVTGKLPPESTKRLEHDDLVRPSSLDAQMKPAQEAALLKAVSVFAVHRYQDIRHMINEMYGIRTQKAPSPATVKKDDAPKSVDERKKELAENRKIRKPREIKAKDEKGAD